MPSKRFNRWTAVLMLWFIAFVALLPPPVVQEWFADSPNLLLTIALACLTAAAAIAAPEIGFFCALRWALAASCLIWALRFMVPALPEARLPFGMDRVNEATGFGIFEQIAGLIMMILAIFLMTPEAVRICTWSLLRMVDSIFFPNERFQRPPLDLRLAVFYIRQDRWEQAADVYERLLSYYPGELELYEALMSIYTGPLADPDAAESLWCRARRRLRRHPQVVHSLKHKLRRLRITQQEVVMDG